MGHTKINFSVLSALWDLNSWPVEPRATTKTTVCSKNIKDIIFLFLNGLYTVIELKLSSYCEYVHGKRSNSENIADKN